VSLTQQAADPDSRDPDIIGLIHSKCKPMEVCVSDSPSTAFDPLFSFRLSFLVHGMCKIVVHVLTAFPLSCGRQRCIECRVFGEYAHLWHLFRC
jgi:hypothetical protein